MLESLLIFSGLKRRWPVISAEDVLFHSDRDSLWIICGNSVYDITTILGIHPGGDAALLRRGGGLRDCTEDYHFHSRYARKEWEHCKVAELGAEEVAKLPRLVSISGTGKNPLSASAETYCFHEAPNSGHSLPKSSTLTVETMPSTSSTPGHYRLHDEPRIDTAYARQRPGIKASSIPKPST